MKKILSLLFFIVLFSTSANSQVTVQGHLRTDIKNENTKTNKSTLRSSQNFSFDNIKFWVGDGSNQAALVIEWHDGSSPDAMVWGYRWNGEASGHDMIVAIAKADPKLLLLTQFTGNLGSTIDGIGYGDALDIRYDLNGAKNDPRISFKFEPPINTLLGQTKFPETPAEDVAKAISEGRKNGVIYHPINAEVYGYPSYDYDYWTCASGAIHWKAGWYDGYWSYFVKNSQNGSFSYSGLGATSRKLINGSWDAWSWNGDMGTTTGTYPSDNLVAAPDTREFYLDKKSFRLSVENTLTLKTNKENDVIWESSNTNIATVKDGVVTPKAIGQVEITAKWNGLEAICKISVVKIAKSLLLSSSDSITVERDESFQFSLISDPVDADLSSVEWKSSSPTVASIDASGLMKALKDGKTIITIKAEDGVLMDTCIVTVRKSLNGLTLQDTLFLNTKNGGTQNNYTLKPTFNPTTATNTKVIWSSLDESVATVVNGKVTALKAGKTFIKADSEEGGYKDSCLVICSQWYDKLTLEKTFISLSVNKDTLIKATCTPDSLSIPLIYTSSDESIAKVDKNGKVTTGSKCGETIITVVPDDGSTLSAKCQIAVEIPVDSIVLSKESITQNVNTTYQLTVKVYPENATFKDITWTTTNTCVTVNNNGELSFKRKGTSKIIATSKFGGKADTCEVISYQPVTKLTVNKKSLDIDKNTVTSSKLSTAILPSTANNKTVTWSLSNDSVVSIDKNGNITPLKKGQVTVYATVPDGLIDSCKVRVFVGIKGLSLDNHSLNIAKGSGAKLNILPSPEDADLNVVWSSSNENIVNVDQDGNIIGKNVGSAKIKVITLDNKFSDSCEVKVNNVFISVKNIVLDHSELEMSIGDNTQLKATISPVNANNKLIEWSSSDPTVASVINGTVTAKSVGTCTITVTTNDGNRTASCEVTVAAPILDKPTIEVQDSSATLTFSKIEEATKYEVSLYKYSNEIPVLSMTYTVDAEGNILTGMKSYMRADSNDKIAISLQKLEKGTKYVVKIRALKEKDDNTEILGTSFSDMFTTSSTVDNDIIGNEAHSILYSKRCLYLINLEKSTCYIISITGQPIEVFQVASQQEKHWLDINEGIYIVTAVKDDIRISKKIVITN